MNPNPRALFLDRDGVVNHEVGYLHLPADVRWVDGIFSLARTAIELGYRVILVTNQSGIARGLYSQQQFDELTRWMTAEFEREQVHLDAVYCCPYHPEHGIGEYKREHEDRKPGPGMLLRGAREFHLNLGESILVGDRCSDIAAGLAAGVRQCFLLSGTEPAPCPGAHIAVDSLAEVERWLRTNS
jgi:D-glycero-D-manno-heptose 1,7-bisphosphate phosphatase